MNTYVVLFRAINVGGKNKILMTDLKRCLETLGFSDVQTYIASGNVILKSSKNAYQVQNIIEKNLLNELKLDGDPIKVLVLTKEQLESIVDGKPEEFGEQVKTYHSDVIFLMGIDSNEAIKVFKPREGVDTIWPHPLAIYSQRLSALRTKSRLNAIMGTPLYKSMTIRTWNTTIKLLEMLKAK
jgi:uncharacterized protein (DUF1697 family)